MQVFFETEYIYNILYNLGLILTYYFILSTIAYIICWWKIFEKEGINKLYSLIPFVNIYKYYKICDLQFWTVFIPFVNIIVLYCSTYVIAKKYRCKRWQCTLAIFLPFIFLPYIAFSSKTNIDKDIKTKYIYNTKDIDMLEMELLKNDNDILDEPIKRNDTKTINNKSNFQSIDDIDKKDMLDEYVYDDYIDIGNEYSPVDTSINEFKELNDNINIDNINISDMDKLDDAIKISNSVEKNIVTNIVDIEENKASKEAIAFGGKNVIEKIDAVQTKNDALTCKRCGSSLVGASTFCPGCGTKLEDCV